MSEMCAPARCLDEISHPCARKMCNPFSDRSYGTQLLIMPFYHKVAQPGLNAKRCYEPGMIKPIKSCRTHFYILHLDFCCFAVRDMQFLINRKTEDFKTAREVKQIDME